MQRTFKTFSAYSLEDSNGRVNYILDPVRRHFFPGKTRFRFYNLNSKYVIKITEGTKYQFKLTITKMHYMISMNKKPIGKVCVNEFVKIFFKPNQRKRYNITVRRIK